MNKYLLLRDNKQSGPYTVPELIAKGIKPYDLVWLEGKSAAWRYPSEVEELKAFAPVVEEQPFDRFYKKPQAQLHEGNGVTKPEDMAIKQQRLPETHAEYLPKSAPENEAGKLNKKVYVNFPGENTPVKIKPAAQKPDTFAAPVTAELSGSVKASAPEIDTSFSSAAATHAPFSERIPPPAAARSGNKRIFQLAIAACVIFGMLSGVLLFNHFRQQKELKDLNAMVQRIEDSQKQQRAMNASLVQAAIPSSSASSSSSPTPPADVDIEPTEKTPSGNVNDHLKSAPKHPQQTVKNAPVEEEKSEPAVVFAEKRPVERRTDSKSGEAGPMDAPKENLFKQVDVKANDYKTGLLGGISNLKLELTNNSNAELQRVAIEIKYLGPEKKVVKKHTVYFENVAPGSHSTIAVPKSNRGVTIEYIITDIKS